MSALIPGVVCFCSYLFEIVLQGLVLVGLILDDLVEMVDLVAGAAALVNKLQLASLKLSIHLREKEKGREREKEIIMLS